ncbi:hypothetical protein SLEP1_g26778 [Rubroshorea leprosula]|uniref:LAGLIDADG homing endonuclease n=1 Tax=Rubroshorea leprosula TaxID=152421 RepID=A0AAV5JN82_9ROSI|nr:hypothetical protein SLEP1_g26778 [Rubroshorea leprosula]
MVMNNLEVQPEDKPANLSQPEREIKTVSCCLLSLVQSLGFDERKKRLNPAKLIDGDLIRDGSGCWISGFTVNVGDASIFIAELWGLKCGLRLCNSCFYQWTRRMPIIMPQMSLSAISWDMLDEPPSPLPELE